ncbi:MAG: hypothetical protein MJ097_04280 [Dorea sp.]|nr:hypothetical protein [Dorea sp.]
MADWKSKFNLFKEKATEVAADLGKKGKDQYDIQKIKASIRSLNRASDKDLKEIGKMYYESNIKGVAVDTDKFLTLCNNIKLREEEIAELEADIEDIKSEDLVDIDDVEIEDAVDETRDPEDFEE